MPRRLDHRIKLRHLRVIDAVASHSSLLRASVALGLSQPALSRTLQDSEALLGLRLFDRHSRGMVPTEAGAAVWAASGRILAELGRLEAELDRLNSAISGSIALGALPVAASGLLPGVLSALKASHPTLQVRLVQGRTEQLLPQLASGELDVIIGRLYPPPTPDGFLREVLYDEPISVIGRAGHPILAEPDPTPAMLRQYELVLPTLTQRMGQEIETLLAGLGVQAEHCLRSSSIGFIRELLHGTDTLTICPRMMMGGDLLRGTLEVAAISISTQPRPAGIIRNPERALAPNVQTLLAALRDFLATLRARGLVAV